MALDTTIAQYDAPEKDLYEVGEMPPMGYVPKKMYAWAIRRERHGEPDTAMLQETVDVPELDSLDVLVLVMAAGVNYNGVWAALGQPISPFDGHKEPYHIAGSDASGIVWAVGEKVTRWKVGDEVVIHCNQDDGDDEECNGGDPMYSPTQRIWGYETPDGSFSQFTRVQSQQLMPRPKHLTWEEAACYTLTLATNTAGANAIGVISDESKRDFVMDLGAKGVLNRKDFDCWGQLPKVGSDEYATWFKETRKFGKAIWDITGKGVNVDMVFEHPGESTFPVSTFVVKKGGMVVICAGTTGFNLTFDVRYMWMHQKRLQLMLERRLDPCMSEVFLWNDLPEAHMKMMRNEHKPGNMSVLVQSPKVGLRTLEDALEARG